jgi:cellulose biosynthesis protein BcsQ
MTAPIIAFFNNKGGVGKTSLTYHLSWMFAERGCSVLAADLDPQANLSAAFLDDDRLECIWSPGGPGASVAGPLAPLLDGAGGLGGTHVEAIAHNLGLVVGDLSLSSFEDELSSQWPDALDGKPRAFRVLSALWSVLAQAARRRLADYVLVDVGPNLGSLNRAALIASDYVVVPLAPDLFSLQGLRNLGPALRRWRQQWHERLPRNPEPDGLRLPRGDMVPLGYVVLQHGVRLDRPVKAYARWMAQIPSTYQQAVLGRGTTGAANPADDEHCLALLKHFRSLVPMAQEARKPIFDLRPADGAIGSHQRAVEIARAEFSALADRIEAAVAR